MPRDELTGRRSTLRAPIPGPSPVVEQVVTKGLPLVVMHGSGGGVRQGLLMRYLLDDVGCSWPQPTTPFAANQMRIVSDGPVLSSRQSWSCHMRHGGTQALLAAERRVGLLQEELADPSLARKDTS